MNYPDFNRELCFSWAERREAMEAEGFKYGERSKKPGQYPQEMKQQAIAMFQRARPDFPARARCAKHVPGS